MKKSLKLIPAIVMLLISAILVSTSTFAWFSMNTTVRATGMQVTAKSNNTFLLIGTDNDADVIQSGKLQTVPMTVADSNALVFPSKPITGSDAGVISAATMTAATAGDPTKWYTAYSPDPAAATSGGTVWDAHVLSSGNFSEYVIQRTVYLTLADGSDHAHQLTVKLENVANGLPVSSSGATVNDAVRILVVAGNNSCTLSNATQTGNLYDTADTTLTDSTVVRVDIYIYYDGSVDSVYTNNIANLSGLKFDLVFDVAIGEGTV